MPPFSFYFLPPPRNRPVNAVVFILLTPPRTARRRPLLNLSARTGACALGGSEGLKLPRAEVNEGGQKSSEGEVRVHGWVKETRARLLFTPTPPSPPRTRTDKHRRTSLFPSYKRMCPVRHRAHPAATPPPQPPPSPRTPCLFFCVY